jgi:hypothetical protein
VDWLRATALSLTAAGVLFGLGNYPLLRERHLIVLDSDEVTKNEWWQFLKEAKESTQL